MMLGSSFWDEKVSQNRPWDGNWGVWGGSWEIFGRLLVPGWCLEGSEGVSGSIFGGSWTDLGVEMKGTKSKKIQSKILI